VVANVVVTGSVAVGAIVGATAVGWAVDIGAAEGLGIGVAASRAGAAVVAPAGGVAVKVATRVGAGDGIAGVACGFFPPQAANESAMIRSRT
jgi:hypothetical protein